MHKIAVKTPRVVCDLSHSDIIDYKNPRGDTYKCPKDTDRMSNKALSDQITSITNIESEEVFK